MSPFDDVIMAKVLLGKFKQEKTDYGDSCRGGVRKFTIWKNTSTLTFPTQDQINIVNLKKINKNSNFGILRKMKYVTHLPIMGRDYFEYAPSQWEKILVVPHWLGACKNYPCMGNICTKLHIWEKPQSGHDSVDRWRDRLTDWQGETNISHLQFCCVKGTKDERWNKPYWTVSSLEDKLLEGFFFSLCPYWLFLDKAYRMYDVTSNGTGKITFC